MLFLLKNCFLMQKNDNIHASFTDCFLKVPGILLALMLALSQYFLLIQIRKLGHVYHIALLIFEVTMYFSIFWTWFIWWAPVKQLFLVTILKWVKMSLKGLYQLVVGPNNTPDCSSWQTRVTNLVKFWLNFAAAERAKYRKILHQGSGCYSKPWDFLAKIMPQCIVYLPYLPTGTGLISGCFGPLWTFRLIESQSCS